jgi:hypothetical protein
MAPQERYDSALNLVTLALLTWRSEMSIDELMRWAERYHHPQLVLSEKDVVRHGERSWHQLFTGTQERIERAVQRIQGWQQRLEGERES